jgi:hypothetical protein
MSKIGWFFPCILILVSCSKENAEIAPVRKLISITPSTVEVGDTITIVGDNEAYLVKGNLLSFSEDMGTTWEKQSDLLVYDFYFFDKLNRVAIAAEDQNSSPTILFTNDKGLTWKLDVRPPVISYYGSMAFYGNVGIVSQYDF